jgi:hypothetical protein
MTKKDVLLLCVYGPWQKNNLKSFPFKVVLSWKQCSCDVIIERVYWKKTNYRKTN